MEIYKITNLINNKIYIGQTTTNYKDRWNKHKWELVHNKHSNKHLQNSWNKYGKENFKIETIEKCSIEELDEKEIYWINYYNSCDQEKGYNLDSGGNKNKKHSEETKKKISNSNKGQIRNEQSRQKMSKSQKELYKNGYINPNKGKKLSEETLKKMSISLKGNGKGSVRSKELRKRISETEKGKIVSEETRRKISEAGKGRIVSKKTRDKISKTERILNDKQIEEVIKLLKEGLSQRKIAGIFNVSRSPIQIIYNKYIKMN